MRRIVIDASVALAWCFPDERTPFTNRILAAIQQSPAGIAPALWAYEMRNILLSGLRRGRATAGAIEEMLDFLHSLEIELHNPASYDDLFFLAQAYRLTVYDAAYLSLAQAEDAYLATLDKDLQRAARECGVPLLVPKEL